jgi:hypothetical protein
MSPATLREPTEPRTANYEPCTASLMANQQVGLPLVYLTPALSCKVKAYTGTVRQDHTEV